jgi:Polyketide cyclase / dehydrase and lipid transport
MPIPIEHRISIQATPETIYRIYENVAQWHIWDPDTKQASLDGPLRAGASGRLVPTKGRAVPMVVTEATPGRSFTVESKIPFFHMAFEHVLRQADYGTEVIHRVTLSGPLSLVIGRMLTKQINNGLPVTLNKLKLLAERNAAYKERTHADQS